MGPHTETPLSWQNTKHKVAFVHHRQQTMHKHILLFRLDEQSRFLRPFVHGKIPSLLNQRRGYQKVHQNTPFLHPAGLHINLSLIHI